MIRTKRLTATAKETHHKAGGVGNSKSSALVPLGVFACFALASPYSVAQESDKAENTTLEEVTVTAQKRSESLQEVPLSINVTTAEHLQRDQVYSLIDLQRVTSSVEINPATSGERTGGVRIRGIGTVLSGTNYTTLGSVAIVVDEVPQGALTFPQLFDMAQVEVLRGPQGTLFGQTASAGVVNVTTVSPRFDEVSGYVGVQHAGNGVLGSEFGKSQVRGAIDMPINDHSAIRFAGQWDQDTGVQKNVWLNRDNVQTTGSIRAVYLNEISDSLTLRLSGEYQKITEDGVNFYQFSVEPYLNPAYNQKLKDCGVTVRPEAQEYCSEITTYEFKEVYGFSAKVDWELAPFTLTSVSSWRSRLRSRDETDYEPLVGDIFRPGDFKTNNPAEQYTQEFRLTSPGHSAFNWVTGVYFDNYETNQEPFSANMPFHDPAQPVGFGICSRAGDPICIVGPFFSTIEADMNSWAVFGDGNIDLSETVNLFGGLRYTEHETYTGYGTNRLTTTNSLSEKWTNWSGRLGARWMPTDTAMYYASVSQGFKPGAISIGSNPAAPKVVLEPEEPLAFEIGTKLGLFDQRMALNATLFYVEHDNYHARRAILVSGVVTNIEENIKDIVAKGLELDVYGNLTENLQANLGYTYNNLTYPDGYVGSGGNSLAGQQVAYAPEHKLAATVEYTRVIGSSGHEGFATFNAVYKSDTRLLERAGDQWVYPAHWTLGGSFGLRSADGHWTLTAYARNITGEDEPFALLNHSYGGQETGGVRNWIAGSITLREVGFSVDYTF